MAVAFLSAQRSKDPSSQVCVYICLAARAQHVCKWLAIRSETFKSVQFNQTLFIYRLLQSSPASIPTELRVGILASKDDPTQ